MDKRRLYAVDTGIIVLGLLVLVGFGVSRWAPWKPRLVVWSCGGNYESLSEYCRRFERAHDCRVAYTAAPVQYLLELSTQVERPPDVLVGRAGPGWQTLEREKLLAREPEFFAIDPFVIITPRGNPAGIQGLEDLGREGVRTTYAPYAMRPRGKCPSHLIAQADAQFHPGLAERWLNNCVAPLKCGRDLSEPILAGRADAAIVPRSTTLLPAVRDRIDVIEIGPKYHAAMKSCRAVPPQCFGVLTNAGNPDLAGAFVDGMLEPDGQQLFADFGYLPITSPEAQEYAALLEVFKPQDGPGWQLHLAKRLFEDGAYASAMRRCFTVYNVFGPCKHDPAALLLAAQCAIELGTPWVAEPILEKIIADYPLPGKPEWQSSVLFSEKSVPLLDERDDDYWVREAEKMLATLPAQPTADENHRNWLQAFPIVDVPILESDPDKNGKRWFGTGEMSLQAGGYAAATREYLKVLTLSYPSSYMPAARFRVAECDYLRGYSHSARQQWEQLASELPDDEWGRAAGRALSMTDTQTPAAADDVLPVEFPPIPQAYDTHLQRGMAYGGLLWEHRMPLYCLKEMLKVSHGVYGPPGPAAAEARYRAGICCLALQRPEAAVLQLRVCRQKWPDSPWARRADVALATLSAQPDPLGAAVVATMSAPLPELPAPAKGSPGQRFNVAEELFAMDVLDDDQCLLEYLKVVSVTDPSGKRNARFKPRAELMAGLCLHKRGRGDAARGHFERVIKLAPESKHAGRARQMMRGRGN